MSRLHEGAFLSRKKVDVKGMPRKRRDKHLKGPFDTVCDNIYAVSKWWCWF
jgi:hypothetical protein